MSGAPPVLEAEGVVVRVGGRAIVDGAGLSLSGGERVALVAPSGAGKTTLLRAIVGLARREAGAVRFHGEEVADGDWPKVRRAVVFVAQRPAMRPGSVRENLAAPFSYKSATSAFDADGAATLLERVGLDPSRLGDDAARLSEGQQKRVSLVRALLLSPAALLLDEPTSGLDPAGVERVETLLTELGDERGLACAIVTHDPEQAARLCHRVVELSPWLGGATR